MASARWICSVSVLALLWGCSKTNSDTTASTATAPSTRTAAITAPGGKEGRNPVRRLVKTGADPDASKIDQTPKDTTVEEIAAEKQPSQIGNRVSPFETTEWKVKATLESVVHEKDGDYYLVLRGDKGGKTVVEVPDPALCKDSVLLKQISAARKELEDRYHPTTKVQPLHDQATVTGVGFLGWGTSNKKRGATGYMGARLMPGLDFQFDQKGS